ncbi:MAG: tetratricopeptide repeat protein [Dysgonamonadaceae bacterium]|jgi:tetratricopeptide (TPR) repeat protein|nr:tetratricopeptide repeat protein [Dysgonamonadaceae bacterium]
MERTQIENTKEKIALLIEDRRLKEAFDEIKTFMKTQSNWSFSEKMAEMETNYNYLIHYFLEGARDPEYNRIYNQLVRDTYALTDSIAESLLTQQSSAIFFEKLRLSAIRPPVSAEEYRDTIGKQMDAFAVIELLDNNNEKDARIQQACQSHEHTVSDFFYSTFSSPRANAEQTAAYRRFIEDGLVPVNDKCMLVSALTMNILQRFDARKIELLLELCENPHPEIALRAIIGIIPISQKHEKQWRLCPELGNRLKLLSDNPVFNRRLLSAVIQFIQARETEKITKKLTEEIIPQMMKLSPMIGKKINLDEWMGESGFDEKNPEWQKIFDDAGLTDKLQEFSEMQLKGADVFHSTFSNLKSYPFFHEMSNWFLPFDNGHSQVQQLFTDKMEGRTLLKSLISSPVICNSDKYSFCFSIMIMPENYRKMMISQLDAESEALNQMQEEGLALNPHQKEEVIVKQYIQDLYRFFKLFPRRDEFTDIFALPLNYHRLEAFRPITSDARYMAQIALYYFEKNNFAEALEAYECLSITGETQSETWQKIGYCKQMLGDIEGALEAYLHADLIEENNTWIIRRTAQCYRLLKAPEKALACYRRLEHLNPADLNVQLNIGHCYLELKQYGEALNNYFKVELTDGQNARAWRSIAWCAFLSRKFDVAQKYYGQIIDNKPNVHDFLNAGHVALCLGNPKQAVERYRRSIELAGDFETFRSMMKEDEDELQEAGVDTALLPIVLDVLRP